MSMLTLNNQPVYVLLYPCEESQLNEMRASLTVNLQALGSYNAREISIA